jgi:alkanesulfonate monooxygenase SsuD/methylene tetrahydromethanopterin reductase-like flavin-dependent oxidoreductase (luciferase family)
MAEVVAARVPAGRLARLGVVLDADDRATALARLCDRAGIDIVWLADRAALPDGDWPDPPDAIAREVVGELDRAAFGAFVRDIDSGVDLLARAGASGADPRFELAWPVQRPAPPEAGSARPSARRSVVVREMAEVARAMIVADDVVLPAWRFADLETAADEVRAEALEAGRSTDTLGVAVLLPVSIGRTQAEADARVVADPLFLRTGHPAETGIFGTLEECQDRVIALAHAGITDLRCVIPATLDAHDVIAQLIAITLGTTDVLIPGSLRSPSPPPPDGWGGRSPVPDRPRVSDGSRRR